MTKETEAETGKGYSIRMTQHTWGDGNILNIFVLHLVDWVAADMDFQTFSGSSFSTQARILF